MRNEKMLMRKAWSVIKEKANLMKTYAESRYYNQGDGIKIESMDKDTILITEVFDSGCVKSEYTISKKDLLQIMEE